LPPSVLVRRADSTEAVGASLVAAAGGAGFRSITRDFGVPASTVRARLRRARANVPVVAAVLSAWLALLDPLEAPGGGEGIAGVVGLVGQVAAAARRRLGRFVAPWPLAVMCAKSLLLAPPEVLASSQHELAPSWRGGG
jgi:hypothetical protein